MWLAIQAPELRQRSRDSFISGTTQLLFMFIGVVSSQGGGTVFIGEEKRGCVLEQLASYMRFPV